ncbi:hypothetical protein [Variovorax gossypii]|uniref:hypothetical protein n=1 Tax=uncultured Variovorax sp. TaxID=114708 RepID=UPI002616AA26|nr:hypothetical protein [uncultured Variovorax sp.]
MKRSTVAIIAGSAAAVLVLSAGVVVYLANQRGAEIAKERVERRAATEIVEVVTFFRTLRGTVLMKDGSRRALVGSGAMLMWVRPVAGAADTWLAVARGPDGAFFGQRLKRGPSGAIGAAGDAQELSAQLVMGGLRDQLREAGADQAQAQVFFDAIAKGTPVPVRSAVVPRN